MELTFDDVARLPMPGDNVAIASRRLGGGTRIRRGATVFELDRSVLQGHRFAVEPIRAGEALLSWELPFGIATRDIDPGHYVCNDGILEALSGRDLGGFVLPSQANFADCIEAYRLTEAEFNPGRQVDPIDAAEALTFDGYDRGARGVGTRNCVVVLGTSSRTASFARNVAARLHTATHGERTRIDGIVAVDHTEGGSRAVPNNREVVLRTLAGFCVHPNVGAVLAVDDGTEAVSNRHLQEYLRAHGYPIQQVPHAFLSLDAALEDKQRQAESQIRQWLPAVERCARRALPLRHLKLALQCGGSDAFSGISGNPLVGWMARELIRRGGAANLAETAELIGAESYVLANVRDYETAQRFLGMVDRFKERAARHGVSAEGNPTGGNKYRGLYNIVLKSIGAARKRDPAVRLDHVIDYGEPMAAPGYYFMDSPGNDPESIAGQVAAGCNIIYFVTGNGAITNFPFVPTIKVITTSERYALLSADMDVNAGAYLDGRDMDELGAELMDLTVRVASGQRSLGERAGHAQVQIWRNWEQEAGSSRLDELLKAPLPANTPTAVRTVAGPSIRFTAIKTEQGCVTDQIGLVLPTSLCSGQVARMAAQRLNAAGVGRDLGLSRFVALVHTEGCGMAAVASRVAGIDALLSYLLHPLVGRSMLIEHGCETTHNDFFRERLGGMGVDVDERFGWASVQMDGGIERAMDGVEEWFAAAAAGFAGVEYAEAGLESLRLGLLSDGPLGEEAASAFARLCQWVIASGGTVVVPHSAGLSRHPAFSGMLFGHPEPAANLAHGQRPSAGGFFLMETPTDHWVETLTGLGATGVEIMLAHVGEHPLQGHPLVPLLQVTSEESITAAYGDDIDAVVDVEDSGTDAVDARASRLLALVTEVASRRLVPRAVAQRNTDFQVTRGLLAVSM